MQISSIKRVPRKFGQERNCSQSIATKRPVQLSDKKSAISQVTVRILANSPLYQLTSCRPSTNISRLGNWFGIGYFQFFGQRFNCPAGPSGCPEIRHNGFLDVISWAWRQLLEFREVHSMPVLNCSLIIHLGLLFCSLFVRVTQIVPKK